MRVVLVAGPPCAGKTTYARERLEPGDLLLDADPLYAALSGGQEHDRAPGIWPFVWAGFYGVLRELPRHRFERRTVWVVQGVPRRRERDRYRHLNAADVVVLETPADECRRRARARFGDGHRLDEYVGLIDRWWADYQPNAADTRLAA